MNYIPNCRVPTFQLFGRGSLPFLTIQTFYLKQCISVEIYLRYNMLMPQSHWRKLALKLNSRQALNCWKSGTYTHTHTKKIPKRNHLIALLTLRYVCEASTFSVICKRLWGVVAFGNIKDNSRGFRQPRVQ